MCQVKQDTPGVNGERLAICRDVPVRGLRFSGSHVDSPRTQLYAGTDNGKGNGGQNPGKQNGKDPSVPSFQRQTQFGCWSPFSVRFCFIPGDEFLAPRRVSRQQPVKSAPCGFCAKQ
jgi:hypothetical protein